MSDPNQPMDDPYSQPAQGGDPYYGGYAPAPLGYGTPPVSPRRPVSPIVLGIIGILYAIYLTACMGVGAIFQLSGDSFVNWLAEVGKLTPEQIAQMKSQLAFTPWKAIQTVLLILLGLVCWIGSVGSLMRREFARKALLVFAIAFLAIGALGLIVEAVQGFPTHKAEVAAQAQSSAGAFAMPLGALIAISFMCAAVFAVFPICVLWFYTRPAVKAWFGRASAPHPAQAPMYYQQ